jgi:hypothetical protein
VSASAPRAEQGLRHPERADPEPDTNPHRYLPRVSG